MPSNHFIICSLLLLPSVGPSIRVLSMESVLHIRWSKYWSFSFNISPSNEHSGLISFRMDCLDLLAVQGTLKSLLQHHNSKASILWCSAFFTVQLSHPYMTTGKTIALTRRTFVGKVMSLLFNMLSRLVITFLPSGKRLLILWLSDIPLHVRATLSLFLCLLAEIELLPCLSIVYSAARNTDGEGNGNPLQGSCLENSRDAGAWWAAVYRVAQSRTRLTRLSSSSSRNIEVHVSICPLSSILPIRSEDRQLSKDS